MNPPYEKDSDYYDQQYESGQEKLFQWGPGHRTRFRITTELLKDFSFNPPLVDLGCGSGEVLQLIQQELGWKELTGADFSRSALGLVENRGFKSLHVNLTESKPRPRQFRSLICLQVLEHIEDDQQAIRESYKFLKEGGRALFSVPYNSTYWSKMDENAGHVRRYEGYELCEKLCESGYEIVDRTVWGAVIYDLYYRLLRYVPSSSKSFTGGAKPTLWKRIISSCLFYLFYADDFLTFLERGPRLFVVTRRPNT